MCVYLCLCHVSGEVLDLPRAGFTETCELMDMDTGNLIQFLEEQHPLLTAESAQQPVQ